MPSNFGSSGGSFESSPVDQPIDTSGVVSGSGGLEIAGAVHFSNTLGVSGSLTGSTITTTGSIYIQDGDLNIRTNSTTDSHAADINFYKSGHNTDGGHTVVAADERLANIAFHGSDGTDFAEAAKIYVEVDGTPGNNDMPGRLVFAVTDDGQQYVAEAARIDKTGSFVIGQEYAAGALGINVSPYSGSNFGEGQKYPTIHASGGFGSLIVYDRQINVGSMFDDRQYNPNSNYAGSQTGHVSEMVIRPSGSTRSTLVGATNETPVDLALMAHTNSLGYHGNIQFYTSPGSDLPFATMTHNLAHGQSCLFLSQSAGYKQIVSGSGMHGVSLDVNGTTVLSGGYGRALVANVLDVYAAASFYNWGGAAGNKGIEIAAGKGSSISQGDCKYIEFYSGWFAAHGGIQNGSTAANPEFFNGSDRRIKRDIAPTQVNGLEIINNLELIEFKWEPKFSTYQETNKIGFLAQNCENVYPEMVSENEHKDYDFDIKNVMKGELIPVLVKAMQEQQKIIEDLQARLEKLE